MINKTFIGCKSDNIKIGKTEYQDKFKETARSATADSEKTRVSRSNNSTTLNTRLMDKGQTEYSRQFQWPVEESSIKLKLKSDAVPSIASAQSSKCISEDSLEIHKSSDISNAKSTLATPSTENNKPSTSSTATTTSKNTNTEIKKKYFEEYRDKYSHNLKSTDAAITKPSKDRYFYSN